MDFKMAKDREARGEEETGQRKGQKVSQVWDNFKLTQTENPVQCVYCKTKTSLT